MEPAPDRFPAAGSFATVDFDALLADRFHFGQRDITLTFDCVNTPRNFGKYVGLPLLTADRTCILCRQH